MRKTRAAVFLKTLFRTRSEPLMSHIALPSPDLAILQRRNEILKQLKKVAPGASLIADQEGRRTFETDALTAYRCLPLAVVLPATTEEVSAILRYCHENHIKVVPRGAGTSLSGGALPLEDAIVLVPLAHEQAARRQPRQSRRPGRGRHHQFAITDAVGARRLFLRARPVEPDRLHRRRQHRHEFRRRALPEIRRHHQQRARRPHRADDRRDRRYRRTEPRSRPATISWR